MTSKEILGADLLDILFDNRNKKYGAYELRRHYNQRLIIALGSAFGIVLLLLFFFSNNKKSVTEIYKPDGGVIITEVVFPPEEIIPPLVEQTLPPQPPPAAELSYSIISMVDNPSPENEMAAMADIEKGNIGTTNIPGPDNTLFQNTTPVPAVINGSGEEAESQSGFIAVEEQPEFPGGPAAWRNFLGRYLQVPASLGKDELKTVKIHFMVDVDGTVTGFSILQSAGREFDNEVIRVLKRMPKWKPAMQNGRPVAVPFTQPVTFVGIEQ